MKNFKNLLLFLLIVGFIFTGCQDDDAEFGAIIAPSNIDVQVTYIDDGSETVAPGLGSGLVQFSASADNATAYHFVIQGQTKLQASGMVSHNFTSLGNNTYPVTVIAYGTGGSSSSMTVEVDVLALYEPPADLLEMLHGGTQKTWRIKAESKPHFGLGPVGGSIVGEWFSAEPNDKDGVGMYDDRYVFNADGTFTHLTGGDVFGRINLIDELGASGGSIDGADVLNLPFDDYTEQYTLTAPSDVETISLSGLGFIGYYTGGNHQYKIYSRNTTEMVLSTADGNNEFEWWFTLTTED